MGKCRQTLVCVCVCLRPLADPRQYCDDNEEQLVVELDVDFFHQPHFSRSLVCGVFFSRGSSDYLKGTKDTDE